MNFKTIFFALFVISSLSPIWASAYEYTSPDSTQKANIGVSIQDSLDVREVNSITRHDNIVKTQGTLAGQLNRDFTFNAQAAIYTNNTNRPLWVHNYDPHFGMPFNRQSPTKRTYDDFTATSQYTTSFATFKAGIDYIEQGPAWKNKLAFGGNQNKQMPWNQNDSILPLAAPISFVAFDIPFASFHYTQYSGQLKESRDFEKYFHTHRLKFENGTFAFSFYESVVYGTTIDPKNIDSDVPQTRTIQWEYTMPFIPYFFAQHYLGNRENTQMGLDAEIKNKNYRIYSEFFLDDLKTPVGFFKRDWWGNKWANTSGWEYTLPFENTYINELIWNAEYTVIMPWVYTHTLGPSHTWSTYGHSLGSPLGPNSKQLNNQIQLNSKIGKISVLYSTTWKGKNKGSHLYDIHIAESDPSTQIYLPRDSTDQWQQMGISWQQAFYKHFELNLSTGRSWGDFKGWNGSSCVKAIW